MLGFGVMRVYPPIHLNILPEALEKDNLDECHLASERSHDQL